MLAALALVGACELVAGIEERRLGPAGGAGMGGDATSTTTSNSAGGPAVGGSGGGDGGGAAGGAGGAGGSVAGYPAPIAYWPMDDTSVLVADAVGTVTGTATNVVHSQAGQVGTAFQFQGAGWIDFGNELDTVFAGASTFTVAMWVNAQPIVGPRGYVLLGKYGHSACSGFGNEDGLYFTAINDANQPRLSTFGINGGQFCHEKLGITVTSGWVHLAWTYDGRATTQADRYQIYFNGISGTETPDGGCGFLFSMPDSSLASLAFGYTLDNAGSPCDVDDLLDHTYYDGLLDEMAVWNTVLPPEQIQLVHDRGAAASRVWP